MFVENMETETPCRRYGMLVENIINETPCCRHGMFTFAIEFKAHLT